MIRNIVGTPGTGKTYDALKKLLQEIAEDSHSASNAPTKFIAQQPPKNQSKNQE